MKKKVFVAFLLMLFVVLLATCVSASTIYKDSEGNVLFTYEVNENKIITSYEGSFPRVNEQGECLTWYVVSTTQEDVNTIKTVASVLTTDENHFSIADGTYRYKGGAVTQYNVVSVNLPEGIEKLNLENSGYRTGGTYTYNPDSTEILFLYLPSTLTELPERIGQGSKMLICQIPSEMNITKISHVSFHHAKCLREINIPSTVTEIAGFGERNGSAFFMCESLEKITFGESSCLETIGIYAFHRNYKLSYVKIPNSVTFIGSHAFSYTSIIDSPFDEGSLCQELGGRAFSDNTSLKSFIVPATLAKADILGERDYGPLANCTGIELVTFGNSAPITQLLPSFFGRATIGKIILPEGPLEIPDRYFVSATLGDVTFPSTVETANERVFLSAYVEIIRFGANFKYFTNPSAQHHSFTNATKGIKEIYLPASFYAQAPEKVYQVSYALECGGSSNVKFFFTGDEGQLNTAIDNFKNGTSMATTNNHKFLGATIVSYNDYVSNPDSYANGNYIFYGYDPCLAFCTPFYKEGVEPKATIVYESYLENGFKTSVCPLCNGYKTGEVVSPLFSCLGYSVGEGNLFGISLCFVVNKDAILEYEKATGKTFAFGIFASTLEKLGNNDAVSPNGVFADYVVGAGVNHNKCQAFEIKVTGFSTEKQMSAPIIMGLYAIVSEGESISVEYIQAEKPQDDKKYSTVIYNVQKIK